MSAESTLPELATQLGQLIRAGELKIAGKLLKKRLGFRTLMDVIPLDASLVKGSHGRVETQQDMRPVVITRRDLEDVSDEIPCQKVRDVILEHLFA